MLSTALDGSNHQLGARSEAERRWKMEISKDRGNRIPESGYRKEMEQKETKTAKVWTDLGCLGYLLWKLTGNWGDL